MVTPTVDVVMAARNEATTVAANVAAALDCRYVREVIVVDDGSTDDTADRARMAGAKLAERVAPAGSKAHAMALGVKLSDAEAILFVDADCTGLTGRHLDEICEPYLDGRATMSIGAFDYGPILNPVVLRWLPLSGERIIPRSVFAGIPETNLDGYTIEMRINEAVTAAGLPTAVRTMRAVSHRTKRQKLGVVEGLRATWHMYRDLVRLGLPGGIPWRLYLAYLRRLTVIT